MKFSLNSFIYRHVIDRILSGVQKSILESLNPESRVLDVACGTGSLSLAMAGVALEVTGIDLSEEMIAIAGEAAVERGVTNVEFNVSDASDLSLIGDNTFDVAVTSMAVHQFNAELAVQVLGEMRRIARRVIIMDYNYPMPPGISRLTIRIIEWIAGGDHFRNFKIFNRSGGLDHFISNAGLKVDSVLYLSSSFRVLDCS